MGSESLDKEGSICCCWTTCCGCSNSNHKIQEDVESIKSKKKNFNSKKNQIKKRIKFEKSCYFIENERRQKARKDYEKLIQKTHEMDIKEFKAMERELTRNVGPCWYQELSERQMEAADRLFVGLRDDLEQGTVHRCLEILKQIGILPIENSKNIQSALEMSRGNDIAFLWFLNEMFYNETGDLFISREYSVNERLLKSCICHLDMITTLRELERILPAKKEIEKPKSKRNLYACKCKHFSPYLEPIPRPKIPISFPLPPPPIPDPNFKPYLNYKNPDFVVNNESNRWYAKLEINKWEKTSDQEIVDENLNREAILNSLCKKYKNNEEKYMDLLEQLSESTKCHCKDITINPDPQDIIQGKIINQIELDTARTANDFEFLAKKYQSQTIIKIILRELIINAENIKNIKVCSNSKECIEEYEKYQIILEKGLCENDQKLKIMQQCNTKYSYLFDYEKIFRDNIFGSDDSIKNGLKIALDLDKYATGERTIEICMKDLWQFELKLWNEKIRNDEKIVKFEKQEKINKNLELIDPSDSELMEKLLKDALQTMRKNPKYILASFPESEKLPVLKQWLLIKSGYKYTRDDRNFYLLKSRKYWDKLKKRQLKIILPICRDICNKSKINWNYRSYLGRTVKELHENYFHRLNFELIKECRQYWPTMEQYLCSILPREIFYSYFPSCEYDILPFRPWKIYEFRDSLK